MKKYTGEEISNMAATNKLLAGYGRYYENLARVHGCDSPQSALAHTIRKAVANNEEWLAEVREKQARGRKENPVQLWSDTRFQEGGRTLQSPRTTPRGGQNKIPQTASELFFHHQWTDREISEWTKGRLHAGLLLRHEIGTIRSGGRQATLDESRQSRFSITVSDLPRLLSGYRIEDRQMIAMLEAVSQTFGVTFFDAMGLKRPKGVINVTFSCKDIAILMGVSHLKRKTKYLMDWLFFSDWNQGYRIASLARGKVAKSKVWTDLYNDACNLYDKLMLDAGREQSEERDNAQAFNNRS